MKEKKLISTKSYSGRWFTAAFCVALFLLAGCGSDSETETPDNDGRVALLVSSGIDVHTRAHDDTWEAGDAIGIYMLDGTTAEAANKQYTTAIEGKEGTFTAADGETIYFPVEGDTRDFIAYYPWQSIPTGGTYSVDVSDQSSQKAIDLMGASKVTGKHKNDAAVAFTFTHKLVKLSLTIKADAGLDNEALQGLKVNLTNQRTKATYDVLANSTVTVDTKTAAATIALLTDANGLESEGIVLPNDDTVDMILEFHLQNGTTFTWAVKSAEKSQKFVAGSKYIYTITIGKSTLAVTSTVTDWTPGNGNGETGSAE